MGKNTPERQGFIIDNLRIEADVEDSAVIGATPVEALGALVD